MTTEKARMQSLLLQQQLQQRLSVLSTPVAVGQVQVDTDQCPYITIGTGVAGTAGGTVKIVPWDWPLAQNIMALPQPTYSDHKLLYVREAGVAANTMELSMAVMGQLAQAAFKLVQLYECPNGTAPDTSQFVTANLAGNGFAPAPRWANLIGQ